MILIRHRDQHRIDPPHFQSGVVNFSFRQRGPDIFGASHQQGGRRNISNFHQRGIVEPWLRVFPEGGGKKIVQPADHVRRTGHAHPIGNRTERRRSRKAICVPNHPGGEDAAARSA